MSKFKTFPLPQGKTNICSAKFLLGGHTGKDGSECSGFCPVYDCGPEETFCSGGNDPNDCPMSDLCVPFANMKGKDGMDCPEMCPTNCGIDEIFCMGGEDDNGCKMYDFCVHQDDPNGCPTAETPTCEDNWKEKKCISKKNNGKCDKNKVKKNCQKTCEFCE